MFSLIRKENNLANRSHMMVHYSDEIAIVKIPYSNAVDLVGGRNDVPAHGPDWVFPYTRRREHAHFPIINRHSSIQKPNKHAAGREPTSHKHAVGVGLRRRRLRHGRRGLGRRRRLGRRSSEAASASARGDRPRLSEIVHLARGRRRTSLVGNGEPRSSEVSEARAEAEARPSLAGGGVGVGARRRTLLVGGSGPRSWMGCLSG
ncbi:hypothetical protein NL676_012055 [Syzygium grande]|nr:hypothetical protein NL676_012055 [Syzygium grande]